VSVAGNVGVSKDEVVHSVLTVMEIIMQHPSLLATHQKVLTSEIASSLAVLCISEHCKCLI